MRHPPADETDGGSEVVAAYVRNVIGALCLFASIAAAQDTREAVDLETSKPMVRGAVVFKAYCKLCHGEAGDGTGRGAKLHPRLHLAISPGTAEFYIKIIREGGGAAGRSPYMPPWQDELSPEQVGDLVAYLSVVRDPVRRGEAVFKLNCILCHGVRGDGNGRGGQLAHPRPADLTRSTRDDSYKTSIVRGGGAAMGRSSIMPPWGKQLTDVEIEDVIRYIDTLLPAVHVPKSQISKENLR